MVVPVPQPTVPQPTVPLTVSGAGLHICEEDKMAMFVINTGNQQGQPDVRIEGKP